MTCWHLILDPFDCLFSFGQIVSHYGENLLVNMFIFLILNLQSIRNFPGVLLMKKDTFLTSINKEQSSLMFLFGEQIFWSFLQQQKWNLLDFQREQLLFFFGNTEVAITVTIGKGRKCYHALFADCISQYCCPVKFHVTIMFKFFLLFSYYLCSLQTDRAAMLDEIVDYVKFLRLQVKVIDGIFGDVSPWWKLSSFMLFLYQFLWICQSYHLLCFFYGMNPNATLFTGSTILFPRYEKPRVWNCFSDCTIWFHLSIRFWVWADWVEQVQWHHWWLTSHYHQLR